MYGENITEKDRLLLKCTRAIYNKKYFEYKNQIKEALGEDWILHFIKSPPYDLIKDALDSVGIETEHISIMTDGGNKSKSNADGGVIYLQNGKKSICLLWIEEKSGNSVSKGKGRGQATGLISESLIRTMRWNSSIGNNIYPLLAFFYGTDFNPKYGNYNIDRIRMDLGTIGNCNPYIKKNPCSAWFFFQEKFEEEELKEKIETALDTNFQIALKILIEQKKHSIV